MTWSLYWSGTGSPVVARSPAKLQTAALHLRCLGQAPEMSRQALLRAASAPCGTPEAQVLSRTEGLGKPPATLHTMLRAALQPVKPRAHVLQLTCACLLLFSWKWLPQTKPKQKCRTQRGVTTGYVQRMLWRISINDNATHVQLGVFALQARRIDWEAEAFSARF
jgi:hypothetical protein